MSEASAHEAGIRGAVGEAQRLLGEARRHFDVGDLDAATEDIAAIARALRNEPRPTILADALWLAALVSLRNGWLDDFRDNAAAAHETLSGAGEREAAEQLRGAWREVLRQLEVATAVRERGADGLLAVLVRNTQRQLARHRGELDWNAVDRDRALLGHLVGIPLDEHGTPQPLVRLARALDLDPIEVSLVSTLAALAATPELEARVREAEGGGGAAGVSAGALAELTFADPTRRAALDRLAPGAPLDRYRVVRTVREGPAGARRLALAPELLWFLRATPLPGRPLSRGVRAYAVDPGVMRVEPSLRPTLERLTRALSAPRSSVLALVGPPGAGKSTLVLAAAAAAGRPTLIVDPALATDGRACMRDAFLHGAALYLDLGGRPLAEPWSEMVSEPGLRLILGLTPERAGSELAAVRRRRGDVVETRLPPLAEMEQAAAWERALAAFGVTGLERAAIEATLCRPGLVVGDIVEPLTEALAERDADGGVVDASRLARCLDRRLRGELEAAVELLPPPTRTPAPPHAVQEWIERVASAIEGPTSEPDGPAVPAPVVVHLSGAGVRERAAVAARLGERVGRPAGRLDGRALLRADDAEAHLRRAFAACARAGAVLLLSSADALGDDPLSPLVGTLGRLLEEGSVSVALAAPPGQLPLPIRSRVDFLLDLDELGRDR